MKKTVDLFQNVCDNVYMMRNKEIDMTAFTKENLNRDGMFLTFGPDRRFVARFKHCRNDMGRFTTFLIKNFTVEEFFDAVAADVPPLKILESKGYMSTNARKACKRTGFPVTPEGFDAMIKASVAKFNAASKELVNV